MNSVKNTFALGRIYVRHMCAVGTPSARFEALKKNQAKFQCDDGLPVFLKGGTFDKVLYQSTWVLILIGAVMMVKLFWDLAKPK